jgi:L-asparaginase II
MMTALQGAALIKTGAEGVFCAALAGLGVGVALKIDDGANRASEAVMAAVIARLLPEREEMVRRWTNTPVLTRRGAKVGEVRALRAAFQTRA